MQVSGGKERKTLREEIERARESLSEGKGNDPGARGAEKKGEEPIWRHFNRFSNGHVITRL